MAKKSSIEKNKHRIKLVKQYASRRRRLKTIASNEALTMEERIANDFVCAIELIQQHRNQLVIVHSLDLPVGVFDY